MGKLLDRKGSSDEIFLYCGRDGVVTEDNGLLYIKGQILQSKVKAIYKC